MLHLVRLHHLLVSVVMQELISHNVGVRGVADIAPV